MWQNFAVALCMGLLLCAMGTLMIRNERFARWALFNGPSRIWVLLLGEARAMKLTRVFFGPLVVVFGVVALLLAAVMPFVHP